MSSDKHCCVPGCKDSGAMHRVLHGFPNPEKEQDRFNTWIYAIGSDILGLENERIYKYRRVCHRHFEENYVCRFHRLSNIAVPTLNIPGPLSPLRKGCQKGILKPMQLTTILNQQLTSGYGQGTSSETPFVTMDIRKGILERGKENIAPVPLQCEDSTKMQLTTPSLYKKSCKIINMLLNVIQAV